MKIIIDEILKKVDDYMRLKLKFYFLMFISCNIINYGQDGWLNLFNGKNLDGWKVLDGDAKFEAVDGTIVGISKFKSRNTFLSTEKEYSDFILEYEILVDDELNSGVQIRSAKLPEINGGNIHGYQIEVDPSKRSWTGGIYDEGRRGWLYNLECNQDVKKAFKHGEWNKFRVEAIDKNIRVWVNGIETADLIDDANSKGIIALQVHSIDNEQLNGKKVKFRNIRINQTDFENERSYESNVIPQISYLTNSLTKREIFEGWKLLWDGKTTNGWRGAKMDSFPEKGWEISNGILTVLNSGGYESRNGGDIVTEKKYKYFELEVDFKLTIGANSGIKYFVNTELNKGEGSAIGCEFQILDDEFHPDAKLGVNGNRTLASLYDLIAANALFYAPNENNPKRVNKYGWNRAKVIVNGKHVEHFLNGIKVVEYERNTQMWKALVACSKYKDWPYFGEFEDGRILLQDHGDEVYFKNIKIKEIN